jgi:hypothetical protein
MTPEQLGIYLTGAAISFLVGCWNIEIVNTRYVAGVGPEDRYAAAVFLAVFWPVAIWFQVPYVLMKTVRWLFSK